jgi:hypothetical protein
MHPRREQNIKYADGTQQVKKYNPLKTAKKTAHQCTPTRAK